jgi:replicative DNA helicase
MQQEKNNNAKDKTRIVYSILATMDKMPIDALNRILEIIIYTKFVQFEGVFTYCRDYYVQMNKMPDKEYLNIQFERLLDTEYPEFHKNYIAEFVAMLEAESTATKTQSLMLQGKFREATTMLTKYSSNVRIEKLKTMVDIASKYPERQASYKNGLKTGIEDYDAVVDFFTYKSLNVLVAPSSNYKTTVGCSICYSGMVNQGMKIAYLTLEDDTERVYYNFMSRHSYEMNTAMSGNELKKYMVPDDRMHMVADVARHWEEHKNGDLRVISHEEVGAFTPMNIVGILEKAKDEMGGLDVVVVDHFNIMSEPIPGMRLSKTETFSYYVRFMTNLAITFDGEGFILLGLSQTNRDGTSTFNKGKDMDTTQIADTSELERSATTVTSLYADEQLRSQGKVKMKILKNRMGERNVVVMPTIKPEYFKVGSALPKFVSNNEAIQRSMLLVAPATSLQGV